MAVQGHFLYLAQYVYGVGWVRVRRRGLQGVGLGYHGLVCQYAPLDSAVEGLGYPG